MFLDRNLSRTNGFPKIIIRYRSFHANILFADGMHKLYPSCQKGNTAIGIAAAGTIFQIAFDGTAHG